MNQKTKQMKNAHSNQLTIPEIIQADCEANYLRAKPYLESMKAHCDMVNGREKVRMFEMIKTKID